MIPRADPPEHRLPCATGLSPSWQADGKVIPAEQMGFVLRNGIV